jgi:hypothetical protein
LSWLAGLPLSVLKEAEPAGCFPYSETSGDPPPLGLLHFLPQLAGLASSETSGGPGVRLGSSSLGLPYFLLQPAGPKQGTRCSSLGLLQSLPASLLDKEGIDQKVRSIKPPRILGKPPSASFH